MQLALTARQYLTLDRVPRLGAARLIKLFQQCSLEQLFSADKSQLLSFGFHEAQAEALVNPDHESIDRCLSWLEADNNHLIGYFDRGYPERLRQISSPPLILFARGQQQLIEQFQIAMVGSRHASQSGYYQAQQFAAELAQAGVTVTSGLALGIDAAAHQGALSVDLSKTIAVVATGLDRVYPKRHYQLATEVIQQGLMLSEFWPGTPPKAHHFPRRNRIISGLSHGVLVVEAALPSGSLITANYAAEQGRDVFAIPGPIEDPLRAGCHLLIQQGAKLVTQSADIIDEYTGQNLLICGEKLEQQPLQGDLLQENPSLDPLLQLVDYQFTSVDQLVDLSQLPVNQVISQLTELELLGKVSAIAGGYVRLKRS